MQIYMHKYVLHIKFISYCIALFVGAAVRVRAHFTCWIPVALIKTSETIRNEVCTQTCRCGVNGLLPPMIIYKTNVSPHWPLESLTCTPLMFRGLKVFKICCKVAVVVSWAPEIVGT